VEPNREIPRSLRSMRNLRQQEFIEFLVTRVGLDHRFDHRAHQDIERRRRVLDELGFHHAVDLFEVPLVQRYKDGAFVRKILIDGADADARSLGNAVRSDRIHAVALQHTRHRIEDRFDSLSCSALSRPSPHGGARATTLKPALDGVEALLLINSGPELVARDEAAAKVAKAAGVKHLVKLSSYDSREQNVGTGVWHARGEAAIRAAGIPFTFVQPSGFMVNALFWANSIKAEGVVRSSTGDGRIPFIHSDDIADVTTKALTTTQYIGESLTITGPEALSYAEMTAKIGSAIGKPLRFQPISDDEERQHLIALGEPEASVEAHLSIYRAIREGRLAPVTDTVERVLGRSPISFDRWVRENVAAFQPKSINRPDTRCS
jgi:uncharacterized protein YbjT (DUF2867 family)